MKIVKLYVAPVASFTGLDGLDSVTPSRKQRVLRYADENDKARCLTAGLLLRYALGVKDDNAFFYGKNGKPYLKNSGLFFNLSHSGSYAVLAAAESEVGVDIEQVRAYSEAVAARCFTASESELLRARNNPETFYRLWTAKESMMKACGKGFSLPPSGISALPFDDSAHYADGKAWYLDWLSYDGHVVCCATEELTETKIISVEREDLRGDSSA